MKIYSSMVLAAQPRRSGVAWAAPEPSTFALPVPGQTEGHRPMATWTGAESTEGTICVPVTEVASKFGSLLRFGCL